MRDERGGVMVIGCGVKEKGRGSRDEVWGRRVMEQRVKMEG